MYASMDTAIACWQRGATALDALAASQATAQGLARRQRQRLERLLQAVAQGKTLYARHLPAAAQGLAALRQLPVRTKPELMQRFDEWVADPRLRLAELQAFTADPARIGESYLGQYTVWESSGSSGTPGIFVQDSRAMAIYDALEATRQSPSAPLRRNPPRSPRRARLHPGGRVTWRVTTNF